MIDFHTHILPALDDGAITVDESIAMARALADFGYKSVCCTPHCIKGYYDLTPQKVREATLMLQADLDNVGIRLDLWPGMEYMLDECFADFADDLLPLGTTKLVLCEAPPQAHPGVVQEGLELIFEKGFVPLVAHPERTPFFYEKLVKRDGEGAKREEANITEVRSSEHEDAKPSFLKRLFTPGATRRAPRAKAPSFIVQELPNGVLFHANLGSFTGYYGPDIQRRAYELLKLGVYTALASDLHDSRSATQVLVNDKMEHNPFLKKLAFFNGEAPQIERIAKGDGEQIGLF